MALRPVSTTQRIRRAPLVSALSLGDKAWGATVNLEQARLLAENWLAATTLPIGQGALGRQLKESIPCLEDGRPLFYIFNLAPQGWLIISDEDIYYMFIKYFSFVGEKLLFINVNLVEATPLNEMEREIVCITLLKEECLYHSLRDRIKINQSLFHSYFIKRTYIFSGFQPA